MKPLNGMTIDDFSLIEEMVNDSDKQIVVGEREGVSYVL